MTANDKVAVVQVLNMYALALDGHQWNLFDKIFTPDVTADFGPAGAVWTGLDNFKQSFAEFHNTLDRHQHTMTGSVVHVDGDIAQAFSYGTWLLVREAAEGGSSWLGNGWYDDELVRTERGWRIRNRTCRLLHWTGNPLVPHPIGEQNPDMANNSLHEFADAGHVRILGAFNKG